MAGQLIQVETSTVSSPIGTVTLTGINSDDVYMLTMNNVIQTTGSVYVIRVQVGGADQTGSHYDKVGKRLSAGGAFGNVADTNIAWYYPDNNTQTNPYGAIHYIFNANNSGEYTFFTTEAVNSNNSQGYQGGGVYKQASQVDGISILAYGTAPGDGVFSSGTFTLYKVV
jgi:hypothetical protein